MFTGGPVFPEIHCLIRAPNETSQVLKPAKLVPNKIDQEIGLGLDEQNSSQITPRFPTPLAILLLANAYLLRSLTFRMCLFSFASTSENCSRSGKRSGVLGKRHAER